MKNRLRIRRFPCRECAVLLAIGFHRGVGAFLSTERIPSFSRVTSSRHQPWMQLEVSQKKNNMPSWPKIPWERTNPSPATISNEKVNEKLSRTPAIVETQGNWSPMSLAPPMLIPPNRTMTSTEMSAMSAIGLGLAFVVVYSLAVSSDEAIEFIKPNLEQLEGVAETVIDVSVPRTASDVLSVALGEGIAGVIGACATIAVSFLLRLREQISQGQNQLPGDFITEKSNEDLFTEAVADGDYFLTRAAALPLVEAIGLPPLVASLTTVVLASVPYELVKLGSQRKNALLDEDKLLQELLLEQQEIENRRRGPFGALNVLAKPKTAERTSVDPASLVPMNELSSSIDFPALFADLTKWLEYDVLKGDLGGQIVLNGYRLSSNVESAVFGFLAALSSQLYADIIYRYTEFGTEEKRKESLGRNLPDFFRVYTTKSLNAAALFGVYESVRGPVTSVLSGILSRGVDSCIGSDDYDLCMETFVLNNPPEASADAQFRSLVTALYSLFQRLEFDDSFDKTELVRSLFVQLYSIANQLSPLSLVFLPDQ